MASSSSEFADPIVLHGRASRWLVLWWLALHAVGLSACFMVDASPTVTAAAAGLVVAHGIWRRPARRAVRIVYRGHGVWSLGDERAPMLELSPSTVLTRVSIRLKWRNRPRPPSVLLVRDQMDAADWRRLRIAVLESLRLTL